jgi:hypothetical protein
MAEMQSEFDLHQLLVPTPTREFHVSRDSGSASSGPNSDAGSFVIPEALSRSNSIYSFSRAPFSTQIANLSSMNLPSAETLAASIKSLSSARKAVKTLNAAAEQIQVWTKKALKVLENLDADEDVEWAAAAGRDGLTETEKTITKFSDLVNVYILSIEELQTRKDIADLKADELQTVVGTMEHVLDGWERVRKTVKKVKKQVELAMEWEELWSTVLAEVGAELDALSQLVFLMEEKRHTAHITDPRTDQQQNVDINELENLVDEPKGKQSSNGAFNLGHTLEGSPLASPIIEQGQDDSMLLSLFARMQPLRASLDFLPMRTAQFQTRAEKIFPSACKELDEKKERLEKNWVDLQKEADNLRKELSEDRWVIVFRNAARQAQKMCESVERSVVKVQEAVEEGFQRTNPAALAKRVESFEAKKMHYIPAIERVLGIIQKGLKDRLTVNGEILRLHKDLSSRMRELTDAMEDLGQLLEPVTSKHNSHLRESISSIISADRSFSSVTMAGTPGTSPASSIDFASHTSGKQTPRYGLNGYSKPRAVSSTRPPPLSNRRSSLLPQGRRPTTPSSAHSSVAQYQRRGVSPAPGPPSIYKQGLYIPPKNAPQRPDPTPLVGKPRWSSTVKTGETTTMAPTYRSVTSPSPYRKAYTPRSISSATALPLRSPLARESSSSPVPVTALRESQYKSFAERVGSPTNGLPGGLLEPPAYARSRSVSQHHPGTIRSPSAMAMTGGRKLSASHIPTPRSPSALSRSPRQSLVPRMSSINARLELDEPSLPELEVEQENRSDILDEEQDQLISEPGSSPLSRRTITRPGSVLSSGRGKRMSMLPLPVGGRTSSLGNRP